jgi:hypothetical protein
MSAARTSEWTTPAPAREDYATHRTTCPVCRIFADECASSRGRRARRQRPGSTCAGCADRTRGTARDR